MYLQDHVTVDKIPEVYQISIFLKYMVLLLKTQGYIIRWVSKKKAKQRKTKLCITIHTPTKETKYIIKIKCYATYARQAVSEGSWHSEKQQILHPLECYSLKPTDTMTLSSLSKILSISKFYDGTIDLNMFYHLDFYFY